MKMKMKFKMLTTALLAGFVSLNAHAGVEQFNPVGGAVNVLNLSGGYVDTITPFGLPALRSITTNNLTFEMLPNINLYGDNPGDPYWRDNGGAGPDGAKICEQFTLWEMAPTKDIKLTSDIQSVVFEFDVDAYDLDESRYSLTAFVKVLDAISGGYGELNADRETITATGTGYQVTISTIGYEGQLLQAGWNLRGQNANPVNSNSYGSATVTLTDLYAVSSDNDAPTPEYMTFATVPYALSDSAISMTADIATDAIYGVEYLFTNTVANTSSGWQSSTNYTETGLDNSTLYTYMVKARDVGVNANENNWSLEESATTGSEDTTAPTPAVMTFASTDVSPVTIKLTAVTASDPSGVEYFFDCTAGGGNDSGWQDSPLYYDTGLVPDSSYSYTVIARDKSAAATSNTVSAVANLTTLPVASGVYSNTLTGFTGNTHDQDVLFQLEKAGLTTGSVNASAIIDLDGSGATFGGTAGAAGRDLLKTIATDYQGYSFEAYATLTFSGTFDLSGYIGMGQGIQTGVSPNWGVPELELAGVNGVVAQFKSPDNYDVPFCKLFKTVDGKAWEPEGEAITSAPIGATETIRARLTYDAAAETVNVAFDKGYTGGTFVPDQDMGTVSTALSDTTSMWAGAPVRVYVGGGEGTLVKDFEIVVTRYPVTEFDVQVAEITAGVGAVFTWDGVADHTYDVQYSTNLVTGSWMDDPSPGALDILSAGGTMSATSTVDSAAVFYRIIAQ